MTPTNINLKPKKYAGAVGFDRSPAPARKLALAGTPPLQEKKHQARKLGGPRM